MELYTALRHFADSWALLAMFLGFGALLWWVFRPGSRRIHDDAAMQIFRNEDAPIGDGAPPARRPAGAGTAQPDSMK